jgi:hypothetical protein
MAAKLKREKDICHRDPRPISVPFLTSFVSHWSLPLMRVFVRAKGLHYFGLACGMLKFFKNSTDEP